MKKLLLILVLACCSQLVFAQQTQGFEGDSLGMSMGNIDEGFLIESSVTEVSVRTNLLYWLGGMMNAGVEVRPKNSRLGIVVNGGYSPFGNTSWNYNLGGWFVAPELRVYLGESHRWFVGAQFLAMGFNYKLSETGYQGTTLGGGVVGGYKLRLSDALDMDFTLGLGYGGFKYDTYYHAENGTNPYIESDLSKSSVMPVQAGVTLIWKL